MNELSFVNMSETSEESQDYSTGQFTSVSTCYIHVLQFSLVLEFQPKWGHQHITFSDKEKPVANSNRCEIWALLFRVMFFFFLQVFFGWQWQVSVWVWKTATKAVHCSYSESLSSY